MTALNAIKKRIRKNIRQLRTLEDARAAESSHLTSRIMALEDRRDDAEVEARHAAALRNQLSDILEQDGEATGV